MQIDKKLYDEINEYCKLNNIKTRDFIHNILKEGFLKEKYGDRPFFFNEIPKNDNKKETLEIENTLIKTFINENVVNEDENIKNKTDDSVKLEQVLKVAEKTFGIISSTVTPDNNMDATIVMPEEWFKPKEKKDESENIKPIVKRKRKLS